jgi:hypothetical protein
LDWKFSFLPSGLIVYLVVHRLLDAAQAGRARKDGTASLFEVSKAIRSLVVLATVGSGLAAAFILATGRRDITGLLIFGILMVIGLLSYPAVIIVNENGVREQTWWQGGRLIPWSKVARIEYHRGPRTTVLVSEDGKKISHTGFHSGSAEFREMCIRSTGLKMQESNN